MLSPALSNDTGMYRAWRRRMDEKKLAARNKKKKNKPARKAERQRQAAMAAAKAAARTRAREGELSVGTFNVRTFAYKGRRPIGHYAMTCMQVCSEAGCDVIGLQETRRAGQGCIEQGEYVIMWSGARAGKGERKGVHGVGLAVKTELWDSVEEEDRTVECISPRMMKVRLQIGRTCGVTFVVGYAPTETARDSDKDSFWGALHEAIRETPGSDHIVVMMDANARTGKGQDGCGDANVMGAYGRDKLNDNGARLLEMAADHRLCLINTYFRPPNTAARHTFQCANINKGRHTLDFLLVRQADRRLVRNLSIKRVDKEESDHNLVHAAIRFPARVAPNRRKRCNSGSTQVRIDLPQLLADENLRTSFQDRTFLRVALRVTGRATGESAAELTAAVLSAAEETAPLARRARGRQGWCSPTVQLEIMETSKEVKEARQQSRGSPGNRELKRRVSKALNKRDRVREKALEAFFEEHVRKLHKHRRGRDQAGFYEHMKGMTVETRRPVTSQNIKAKDGKVLREASLISGRWSEHLASSSAARRPPSTHEWPTRYDSGPRACRSTTSHLHWRWRRRLGGWPTGRPSDRTTSRLR